MNTIEVYKQTSDFHSELTHVIRVNEFQIDFKTKLIRLIINNITFTVPFIREEHSDDWSKVCIWNDEDN